MLTLGRIIGDSPRTSCLLQSGRVQSPPNGSVDGGHFCRRLPACVARLNVPVRFGSRVLPIRVLCAVLRHRSNAELMRVPEESYLWQFITRHNASWASELSQWQMKRVTYLLAKLVLVYVCGMCARGVVACRHRTAKC